MGEVTGLVEAMLAGDETALEALTRRFNPQLNAVARGYLGQDAEDAVQEVWLKLWRLRTMLKPPRNFLAFMTASVRHQCVDIIRKPESRARAHSVSYEERVWIIQALLPDYRDPEEMVIRQEAREAIRGMIDALADIYALPLKLYYLEDLPLKDVAKMLDIPMTTLKWRLHAGRQQLRKQMSEGEIP